VHRPENPDKARGASSPRGSDSRMGIHTEDRPAALGSVPRNQTGHVPHAAVRAAHAEPAAWHATRTSLTHAASVHYARVAEGAGRARATDRTHCTVPLRWPTALAHTANLASIELIGGRRRDWPAKHAARSARAGRQRRGCAGKERIFRGRVDCVHAQRPAGEARACATRVRGIAPSRSAT
jgi:hypothetical protein